MSVPTVAAKPPPGRGWYILACALVFAALAAMGIFIFARISGIGASLTRVVVPGQAELRLDKTGDYTIFHEYRSVVDGRVYYAVSLSGLRVTVTAPDGSALALTSPRATSRYNVSGRSGVSVFAFNVAAPGTYRLTAFYEDGRSEPRTVLAVGSGFVGSILLTVLGAFLIMIVGVGAGVALGVTVYRRRQRARLAGTVT
jgi:hypothetical protein